MLTTQQTVRAIPTFMVLSNFYLVNLIVGYLLNTNNIFKSKTVFPFLLTFRPLFLVWKNQGYQLKTSADKLVTDAIGFGTVGMFEWIKSHVESSHLNFRMHIEEVCETNNLLFLNWLATYINTDTDDIGPDAAISACRNGHLSCLNKLYSMYKHVKRPHRTFLLTECAIQANIGGHLNVLMWLKSNWNTATNNLGGSPTILSEVE